MNLPAIGESRSAAIIQKTHQLPPLPYGTAALEPVLDARTMTLHHGLHHAAYVENLNAALAGFPDFRRYSALWLLRNLEKVPKEIRVAVHHNAGGHVNHSLYWRAMKPVASGNGGKANEPAGALLKAIDQDFGGFAAFQIQFEKAGNALFGAGWVWLARTTQGDGKLKVITTAGHDHPMMHNHYPLLLNDVWEHAYYLRYENRRAAYLQAWWAIVDWEHAARCFELSHGATDEHWDAEGGHQLPPALFQIPRRNVRQQTEGESPAP